MVAVLTVFYWAINFIWLLLVVGGIMASLLPDTKVTTWSIILVVSVLATLITLSLQRWGNRENGILPASRQFETPWHKPAGAAELDKSALFEARQYEH